MGASVTLEQLRQKAEEAIAEHPDAERDSMDDRLLLSIPEPSRHNGYRVRVFAGDGPLATIINGKGGRLTVYVSARRVLDYLSPMLVATDDLDPT